MHFKPKIPLDWWDSYGNGQLELQKFAIRVHTKRRNHLMQKTKDSSTKEESWVFDEEEGKGARDSKNAATLPIAAKQNTIWRSRSAPHHRYRGHDPKLRRTNLDIHDYTYENYVIDHRIQTLNKAWKKQYCITTKGKKSCNPFIAYPEQK
ncbi:hypothetical protein CR513_43991, partial [Mucuna pruriens]